MGSLNEQPIRVMSGVGRRRRFLIGWATMALSLSLACRGYKSSPSTLQVAAMGHLVVGGSSIAVHGRSLRPRIQASAIPAVEIDPNGDFSSGATYVRFIRLAAPRHALPILLLPGGGFSGAIYETTPDGRPGWESFFLRAGYSVFTADLQQTGRSPWSRYPEVNPVEPTFRDRAFLWETFRIGPPDSYRSMRPFSGTRFPVSAFDTFAQLAAPRFRSTPDIEALTLEAIVERVCPCVLLAHSAAAGPALTVTDRTTGLVNAVIVIEPSTVPESQPRAPAQTLVVWGDFLAPEQTQPSWAEELIASRRFVEHRVGATFLDLPANRMSGNSHMLMSDLNSDLVAALIDEWLRERGF